MLSGYGRVIKLPPFKKLQKPVASHGDILIFKDKMENKLYLPREYYEENRSIFGTLDVECVDEVFKKDYPEDIYLDALLVGDTLICKEKFTAKMIKTGKRIIDVKQGYARCSVCLLGTKGAITADGGIGAVLRKLDVEVLEIQSGGIELCGYNYGFIGGASLVVDKTAVFFGNVEDHPDGKKILDFVRSKGFEAEYPRNFPLTDFGSAVIV